MAMPWQLREGLKRRVKGAPPRPIAEQLPQIAVHLLPIPSTNDRRIYTLPHVSLRWPHISTCRFTCDEVEFHHEPLHRGTLGEVQTFQLKHIRTGFGIRHAFLCNDCGRPVLKLYYRNHHIACRYCHNAIMASQALNQHDRPVLQATRLASFLDNKPRLFHRSQERLKQKLGDKVMLAQRMLGTRARGLLE
jgi:hypothetical protein